MFKPRWKKEAIELLKGSKKFVHYNRDRLTEDRISEIESRRQDLSAAIKSKDLEAVKECSKQVRNTCEKSLAHYKEPTWLEQNIETLWVPVVIILAIRAYFVQPFRIPTGSMQPSLNGIIAESKADEADWKKPFIGKRVLDFIVEGKTYKDIVADKPKNIVEIKDSTFLIFSGTRILFSDGSSVRIGCPENELTKLDTIKSKIVGRHNGKWVYRKGTHFEKGDPIFQGTLVSGDLVLVDKMSYHFRDPKRGEAFVFDTRGIDTEQTGKDLSSQQGGTHYIKRLVGVPGDTLQIKEPHLHINDLRPKEETILRVGNQEKDKKGRFYSGYVNPKSDGTLFSNSNFVFKLKSAEETEDNNMREFFALGDNSPNSLDSRFWGTVKQHNLVGPAFFSLWPFASGHWGFID